ncbi:MAG: type II toxin-antitoxin system RelE/ParE family toxin [Candidatus Melainabacteria bacterium]|nr:MAG: type II toxin-antitoxin system RelE/ParE family toxin [Candidatus Melainabacteria bacterium]
MIGPTGKETEWIGDSVDIVRSWSPEVKENVGRQLRKVQEGKQPTNFKPMNIVGAGVFELKFSDDGLNYRVFYVVKFEEAVYILHAFTKKSQKTSEKDLELASKRYKQLLKDRTGNRNA